MRESKATRRADKWQKVGWVGTGIGVVVIGLSILAVVFGIWQATADAQWVRSLPVVNARWLGDLAAGDDVVVSGVLDATTLGPGEMVVYALQVWVVSSSSESGLDGGWRTEWVEALPMVIEVDGQTVFIKGAAPLQNYAGFGHSMILREGNGQFVDGHAEGAERVWGLQNGDPVTVLGTVTIDQQVRPTVVMGGDVQALYDYHLHDGFQWYLGGGLGVVVGLFWIFGVWLVFGTRGHNSEQQPAPPLTNA